MSLEVIVVSLASWVLYDRGKVLDAAFVLLFTLANGFQNSQQRLFVRLALPCLALSQYLFHYSQTNLSCNVTSRTELRSGQTSMSRRSSPRPSPGVSPHSSAQGSPEEKVQEVSGKTKNKAKGKGKTKEEKEWINMGTTSTESSGTAHRKKTFLSSSKSRKKSGETSAPPILIIALHLAVIISTVGSSPDGLYYGEATELLVITSIMIYIFCLPVLTGLGVLAIGAALSFQSLSYAASPNISIFLKVINFSGLWSTVITYARMVVVGLIQLLGIDALNLWRSVSAIWSTLLELSCSLVTLLSGRPFTVIKAIVEKYEYIYTVLFLIEPSIMDFFSPRTQEVDGVTSR